MFLKEIIRYPVKSIAGVSHEKAFVEERGIAGDRRWMLIDEQHRFLSQRNSPEMALFDLAVNENSIEVWLRSDHSQKHTIPLTLNYGAIVQADIWNDTVDVIWPELSADQWFSKLLKKKCKLVYMPDNSNRLAEPELVKKPVQTSLSDGYPLLLTSCTSLADLNQRAGIHLEMKRFRPNLIVDGAQPYEEDRWKIIKIGEVHFQLIKPCARCVITTIDPSTGQKGNEPLHTLSTYRKKGNRLLFGQNMICLNEGVIHVNDVVNIIE